MGSTGSLGSDITSAQASAFVNYYLGNPQTGVSQDFGQVNRVSSTRIRFSPNRSKFHQSC